jgi:hypothetical protein
MNEVARRAGLRVEYVYEDGWTDIIAMVRDGKADIAPGMGISRDRSQVLAFSAFIDAFPISFFIRPESGGIDSSAGRHLVGAVQGSVTAETLRARKDVKLALYESYPNGLFDLLSGKLDAFAGPAPTLWQIARDAKVEDRIKVVDKPITEIRRAIALRKADTALLERLNAAIGEYVGTPAYRQAYAKWYGKAVPYWTEGRIVAAGSTVLLVVIVVMAGWRYLSLLRLNRELQTALAEIKSLRGILPVCASCKKIRDEKGAWHQMEAYIQDRTDANFSHGICPDCATRLYPKYTDKP